MKAAWWSLCASFWRWREVKWIGDEALAKAMIWNARNAARFYERKAIESLSKLGDECDAR